MNSLIFQPSKRYDRRGQQMQPPDPASIYNSSQPDRALCIRARIEFLPDDPYVTDHVQQLCSHSDDCGNYRLSTLHWGRQGTGTGFEELLAAAFGRSRAKVEQHSGTRAASGSKRPANLCSKLSQHAHQLFVRAASGWASLGLRSQLARVQLQLRVVCCGCVSPAI